MREKFAYALVILDGRARDEQRGLGIVGGRRRGVGPCARLGGRTSTRKPPKEAARLGTLRGITNQVADAEKTYREGQRSSRIAAWFTRQLTEAGGGGLSEGELRRRAASRDRYRIGDMLANWPSKIRSNTSLRRVSGWSCDPCQQKWTNVAIVDILSTSVRDFRPKSSTST